MSKLGIGAFLLAAVCLLDGNAHGQVLYGNLVGVVTDPTQGAVVGATVQISNKATGYSAETKADGRGAYDFSNIPPGVYDIRITAAGFQTFEAKDITIAANNIARVDAPLKVGNVNEVITVGAEV